MVRGNDINDPPDGGMSAGYRPMPGCSDRLKAALSREGVRVNARLASAGPVDLVVYDAQGRLVRRLYSGWLGAGNHDFTWDCRHGSGRSVATGTYFVRLQAVGTTDTARVPVIGR
jgi:hypothetical protein